jgi:hypothetical protein
MRTGLLLGLVLLLVGCTYTFLPLVPQRNYLPERTSLTGRLEVASPDSPQVLAQLQVRRLLQPGYLELRWYREETLLAERSVWVPAAGLYQVSLPRPEPGYYRLTISHEGRLLLQLDLGTPRLPDPPAP